MAKEQIFSFTDMDEDKLLRSNKKLLSTLLLDFSTGKNIKWATDNYSKAGIKFEEEKEIQANLITGWYNGLIRPRAEKDTETKIERTRNKAEVFTPSWIIKKQVDAVLEEFKDLSLWKMLSTKWLEITCGEAPYMANRYDMLTGEIIPLDERSGFIDKKFQLINKKINEKKKWIEAAYLIYKSSYGYEYQGDSLLLARENLLLTFIDNYFFKFGEFPKEKQLLEITEIISINVLQMDGLTYEVPYSKTGYKPTQLSMFGQESEEKKEPTLAKIKMWDKERIVDFRDIAKESEREMKFDVVIGNPPYQDQSIGDSTQSPPIYHLFIDESIKIGEKVLLITPGRFLFNAGATPKAWNKKMLSSRNYKVIFYEQKSSKIFKDTDIKGGIAISYLDKNLDIEPIEIFSNFEEINSMVKKIRKSNITSLSTVMCGQNQYKFTDKLHEDFSGIDGRLSKGHKYDLTTSIFEKLPEIFLDEVDDKDKYIRILGREKGKRVFKWVKIEYIRPNENLHAYKVLLPKSNGSGAIGEVLSTPLIGEPLIGYTQTFISVGFFDNVLEVENLLKYIKTKFARVLLGVLKITQDNPPEKWKYVPLQDFTDSSDIDWSKSIPEIDQQLYRKYGLDQKEIDFIETNVKEMK